VINKLYEVICERRDQLQADSYVASLIAKGPDAILKKVGEETAEIIIATKNRAAKNLAAQNAETETDASPLVHEIADLTFHLLVLMAEQKIPPSAVTAELERRFGTSGLTEKANR